MKLDVLNPHAIKIIIAARSQDSILAISRRIGLSYGWTYKWCVELDRAGILKKSGKKIFLNEKSPLYKKMLSFLRSVFSDDVSFHYSVLKLFGIKYCFTGSDAVFVWTDGGYNIARSRSHYPIFIKVASSDRQIFEYYVKKLGLKGRIHYMPVFLESFSFHSHNKMPVDSLDETIVFMKKYIYNFQPALEMIQDMYGKKIGIRYKEVKTNA